MNCPGAWCQPCTKVVPVGYATPQGVTCTESENLTRALTLRLHLLLPSQVLGHTKTILVLTISWTALHEHMSWRKLCGMVLAVTGMVLYGYLSSSSSTAARNSIEGKPLLPVSGKTSPAPAEAPGTVNPLLEQLSAEGTFARSSINGQASFRSGRITSNQDVGVALPGGAGLPVSGMTTEKH